MNEIKLFKFNLQFIVKQKNINLGTLDSNEQTILANWYNSWSYKGSLNWNTGSDLCLQTGVYCDSSNPQRIYKLYFFFHSFVCLPQIKI